MATTSRTDRALQHREGIKESFFIREREQRAEVLATDYNKVLNFKASSCSCSSCLYGLKDRFTFYCSAKDKTVNPLAICARWATKDSKK